MLLPQDFEATIDALSIRLEEEQKDKAAVAEVSLHKLLHCLPSCLHMTTGFVTTQKYACVIFVASVMELCFLTLDGVPSMPNPSYLLSQAKQ